MYVIKLFDVNRYQLSELTTAAASIAAAIRTARRATKKNGFAFFYCLTDGKGNIIVKECPARNWIEFQTDRNF